MGVTTLDTLVRQLLDDIPGEVDVGGLSLRGTDAETQEEASFGLGRNEVDATVRFYRLQQCLR